MTAAAKSLPLPADKVTFSTDELSNHGLFYSVGLAVAERAAGTLLVNSYKIVLVKDDTGEIIAEAEEGPTFICNMDVLPYDFVMYGTYDTEITAGAYKLKMIYRDDEKAIYERSIKVTK